MSDSKSSPLTVEQHAQVFERLLFPPEGQETETASEAKGDQPETQPETTPASEVAETAPETTPEPERFKVKVNGQEVEVTLEEALAGYQRLEDYTRKTQTLAEHRKQLEQDLTAARQARAQFAEQLERVKQELDVFGQEPDWKALRLQTSPEQFAETWDRWKAIQGQRDALKAKQDEIAKAQAEDFQKLQSQVIADEQQKLLQALPDWADEAKAKAGREAVWHYAKTLGYTDEQIAGVSDHRFVVMASKAAAWDDLQAKKAQKSPSKSKTVAPGANKETPNVSAREKALANLATAAKSKSGRTDQAAIDYFLAREG